MASTTTAWQWTTIIDGKLEKSLSLNHDVPIPDKSKLTPDQLLVEVIAAAVNPVDYKAPESGWIGNLLIRGRPATPGLDFCGRIIAKHESNSSFSEGQLVFGAYAKVAQFGTLSRCITISVNECAPLPEGINPNDAAAVGCAATTALQSVPSSLVKPGSRVFINGGSGGVGFYTIQFAKALSAEVTTTCSTGNIELCKSLGADRVIDYTKTDVMAALKEGGPVYDLVVDNVGNLDLSRQSHMFMKKGAAFMQVGVNSINARDMVTVFGKMLWPGSTFRFIQMKNEAALFAQIGKYMAEGKVRAVIDEIFEFEDVPRAYEKLKTGHARGKIVIQVNKESM
ncbi:zinc-binding oxidoreductase [Hypoxylon rubiginosum]|uniref:Zinc-binding oxidoreductase n=1 Tax=Hypoxylon rubiginosum TaxID=110542 RepID=A0ACC0CL66_9PEZI|nr:zinc-binding oxidoreductase [Hypoxylon rubiginosum]